jgi:Protein of unknown function DUF58
VLTRRGISTLVVAISLTAVGWVLVIRELMIIGVTVGLVTLLAVATVWLPWGNAMRFTRSFAARGVHSGDIVRVDLAAQGRWTPTLSIQERLPGGRSITANLAGKGRTLSFETPPLHRGLNLIGPTLARRTDFFALVHRTSSRANASPLLVWPARVTLDGAAVRKMLVDPTMEPRIGVMKPGRPVAAFEGDLRAYVPGDEPRRIHWPSTARTGNLVVRTDASVVSENRYVFTIDLDPSHHDQESFELLLSVATSCVLALLPVPPALLHREDRFDDDLVVEVIEGEHSSTPGRHRFRYPELLLDRLALAAFSSSKASSKASRSATARGGLLLGGPATDFVGSTFGIRCGDTRPQQPPQEPSSDKPNSDSNVSSTKAVLQLNQLNDLTQLVQRSTRSTRSTRSSRASRSSQASQASGSSLPSRPARLHKTSTVGTTENRMKNP